jgi:VCBS repeat-containing protein
VRYSFEADRALSLADDLADSGESPVSALTEDTNHAGTQTVNDDGSTDYAYTDRDKAAVTLTVGASGILTRAAVMGDGIAFTITFGYGPQHIGLPTPATTISTRELRRGIAYVEMKANVKEAADETARNIRNAANGAIVSLAALRREARDSAGMQNEFTAPGLVKVVNISGGVKLRATNPWTHTTVAYTVKASGRLVVVRKA